MTATILDGRQLARTLRAELRARIQSFTSARGVTPTLHVIQVSGDASADRYVRSIRKACDDTGVRYLDQVLPAETTQPQLEAAVRSASSDTAVHGVLLQLPLPGGLDSARVIAQIHPHKDVDGVHPENAGLLAQGRPRFVPNTPAGGMELLRRHGISLAGKRAVVVGRSLVVGKPLALLLLQEHATVTICHSRTGDLASIVREAEVVAAATGRPGLIDGSMLRPGAVVLDFGINVLDDGSLVGDVDFASASAVAGAITPVPGGTGPVTNMMLIHNVVRAAEIALGQPGG